MAKTKKNKKANADRVFAKKSNTGVKASLFGTENVANTKKINPFEVHINKEKFQILGRTCKHDKGLPGVSRAKAVKKRKDTLGQEYSEKNKTNQFRDRRIGRHVTDGQLTEQIMNARFVAEKMSQMKPGKSSKFNLNDDEVLTHRGQTLEEIEQFRDERSDDEDLEDEGLNADFTEVAHFGGEAEHSKDRKTAIEEMILEQKKRKIEVAKEKDEIHDLTEKLDTNYKDLMGLMGKMSRSEMKAKPVPDEYDKIMREMVFEPRSAVTDKLISVEDAAKNEKERLEKLENERLRRMRAEDEGEPANEQLKHRSADELDDGYFAYGEEEADGCLVYNLDGKLATNIGQSKADVSSEHDDKDLRGDEEKSDEDAEESGEESEEEDSDEEEDRFSDLRESNSEEDAEDELNDMGSKKGKQNVSNSINRKTKIRSDLPYTIEMPQSYKEFVSLLSKYTPDDQGLIVERLIKCNHPKLEGVNREAVVKLFTFLLQYINELFSDASPDVIATYFKTLDRLNPHMFDLMHLNPERMSQTLLNVIQEKYAEYRKNTKLFPGVETVVFLKLVSNYFSTSDFRHPVATPCYIFIQHVLSRARVRTRQDIAIGLFLVTISLEFSQQSKRFLPGAFNFLLGIIFISIPKRPIETMKIVPPFQSTGPMSKLLTITKAPEDDDNKEEEMLSSEDFVSSTFTRQFKIKALDTTFKLIQDAITNIGENVGACYLAEPFIDLMKRLNLDVYPEYVRRNCATTREVLDNVAAQTLTKIVPPAKKPKALRLFEPRFETVYDDKRRPKLTKEKEEKIKLVHKLKRETKGAVREIRRDTEFLQKMRIKQQIQSDSERKEKVKRIYQEASVQQGELNELTRAKKKKKF